MQFTYDAGDEKMLANAMRLIGRGLQARLSEVTAHFRDERLKRRLAPIWCQDIQNAARRKPRLLLELLGREASMVNSLIDLGTQRHGRTARRFLKTSSAAARVLGLDSAVLQDLVLRTGIENLSDGGLFEDSDLLTPGSPDTWIGTEEDGDHRSSDSGRQMADSGIVPDIEARL